MIRPTDLPAASPSIAGHPSVLKQKRPRVSAKMRKRALSLEQQLKFLQDKFTEKTLSDILQTAIVAAHRLSERTRNKDRDSVLLILETYDCAVSLEEIMDDTGLSRWEATGIIKEFILAGLVKEVRQGNPKQWESEGAPVSLFALTHTAIGSDFSLNDCSPVSLADELE